MGMNNKAVLICLVFAAILVSGCTMPAGTCGDGICDAKEKANSSLCPKDCTATKTEVKSINGVPRILVNG
jgi:hypothetical protein